VRLFLTARDAGAAAHVHRFYTVLAKRADWDIAVAASGPALNILRETRVPVTAYDRPGAQAALSAQLAAFRPHAMITGGSGLQAGLDEWALDISPTPLTYVFQDFPGSLNCWGATKPQTYLVETEDAARLTRQRFSGQVKVVGSIRAHDLEGTDVDALRSEARRAAGINGRRVCFYGQPLWFLEGYARSLAAIGRGLGGLAEEVTYRAHPAETVEERSRAVALLSEGGRAAQLDPVAGSLASVAATDLLLTCFSSCARDRVALNSLARAPLGGCLYILTEPDVHRFLDEDTGSHVAPFADSPAAAQVTEGAQLHQAMKAAMEAQAEEAAWKRARDIIRADRDPVQEVVEILHQDLAALAVPACEAAR